MDDARLERLDALTNLSTPDAHTVLCKVEREERYLCRELTILAGREAESILLGEDHRGRVLERIEPAEVDPFPASHRRDRRHVVRFDQLGELAATPWHHVHIRRPGDQPLPRVHHVMQCRLACERRA